MNIIDIIDIYWSKDFLLNITAEIIGVILEVFLVTVIIKKYFDKKDFDKWNSIFNRRLHEILISHYSMTDMRLHPKLSNKTISKEDMSYEFMLWAEEIITSPIGHALMLIPPDFNNSAYIDVESYKEAIENLKMPFINNNIINIDDLYNIDKIAERLYKHLIIPEPQSYLWGEFISSIEKRLT